MRLKFVLESRTNVLYIAFKGDYMYKTFRFRLYPNDNQIILINKTFGCYSFIYNYFLNICKDNGYRCAFDMIKEIPSLKKIEWLKEIDSCSLRCAVFNLEDV